jgi:hypothetical protein
LASEQRKRPFHAGGFAPSGGRLIIYAVQQATFASPHRKCSVAKQLVAECGNFFVPAADQNKHFGIGAEPVFFRLQANVGRGVEILEALMIALAAVEAEAEAARAEELN